MTDDELLKKIMDSMDQMIAKLNYMIGFIDGMKASSSALIFK